MHPVAYFDLICFLTLIFGLIVLLKCWKSGFERGTKLLLAGLVAFMLIYSLCLALEWSGTTSALESLENFIGALIPMWWAFVFHAFIHETTNRELRRSEEKYRNVVEDQTELIVRWLPDGSRTFVNDSYCRYFGLSYEEAMGTSFFDLINEEDRDAVRRRVASISPSDPVSSSEHRIVRPDGSLGWNQWTDRGIFDEQGRFVEFQSVGRDITQRKRLEEQEQRHQAQLVHISRLTVAGELASGLAHELNQPLAAIGNYGQVCQRMIDSGNVDLSKLHKAVREISGQAMRGGEIIRRMRDFVRKQEASRSVADFNEIVREAIELMRMQARDGRVTLQIELADEPLPVMADTVQIQQVIVNIMQNGFDAMAEVDECDRVLTVRTSRKDESTVEIAVVDRGPGMSEEAFERMFESFFTTKSKGLGIGLSISRSIIEGHGGHIWAAPNPGGGATFRFELPLKTGRNEPGDVA